MKCKDLIALLAKQNQEAEVVTYDPEWDYYRLVESACDRVADATHYKADRALGCAEQYGHIEKFGVPIHVIKLNLEGQDE